MNNKYYLTRKRKYEMEYKVLNKKNVQNYIINFHFKIESWVKTFSEIRLFVCIFLLFIRNRRYDTITPTGLPCHREPSIYFDVYVMKKKFRVKLSRIRDVILV